MDDHDAAAMDALAFIELTEANISAVADADAWDAVRGQVHEAGALDDTLLGEVFDEATLLA